MFSLFNFLSIFPGCQLRSAEPICPYVRTPTVADPRLRQAVVLYVLPSGVVELGGTGGLGVVLRVCLQSSQLIETQVFEIPN